MSKKNQVLPVNDLFSGEEVEEFEVDENDPFFKRTLLSDQEIKTDDPNWRIRKTRSQRHEEWEEEVIQHDYRGLMTRDRLESIRRSGLPLEEQSADDWVTAYDLEEERMMSPSGKIKYGK